MFKFTVIVSLLTTLFVQFSTENAIPNTDNELNKKLAMMWKEVDVYKMKVTLNDPSVIELETHPLMKAMYKIDSNVLRRLNEHFNKIEEQARISGKLDNVLIDSVYHEIFYDEMKNSDIFHLYKQELKSIFKDEKVHKIILQLVDKCIALFHEAMKALIHEMKTNPRQIFEERTEEELDNDRKRYQPFRKPYTDKIMKFKDETLEELKQIGKESDFERMITHFENL